MHITSVDLYLGKEYALRLGHMLAPLLAQTPAVQFRGNPAPGNFALSKHKRQNGSAKITCSHPKSPF